MLQVALPIWSYRELPLYPEHTGLTRIPRLGLFEAKWHLRVHIHRPRSDSGGVYKTLA